MGKHEWRIVKTAVFIAMISLVIGGGSILVSSIIEQEVADLNLLAKSNMESIRKQHYNTEINLKILKKNLPQFNKLIDRSVIGDENRLDWVETLRLATDKFKIENIEFRIEEQKEVKDKRFYIKTGYSLYQSRMHLNMQLFHEGDYLNVMEALEKKAKGIFHVDQCNLFRSRTNFEIDESKSNVNAECTLSWYTVRFQSMQNELNRG